SIDLRYGGQASQSIACTSSGTDYQSGAVVFNDPCGDIAPLSNCTGTLAYGGPLFYSSTETFDGTPWHPATGLFVVVNDGAQCIGETDFAEMITHELGHGLGFGHHTDPDATMYSQCCHYPRGAGLGATDSACAAYLYPEQATPQPPTAPAGLTATAASSTRVDLAWTDTSGDEDGFRIYRSTGGGFFQVGAVGPGTTAWSDTSLGPCASVQYRVTAYNSAGESTPSNVASAETPGVAPEAPSAVMAQAPGPHTVIVSWSNGAVGQDTVEVQRATGPGTFFGLATLPGAAVSFTDTSVQPATTYRYRLRAFNGCGASPDSPVASVLVPPGEEPLAVTFQWDPAAPWIGSPVRFAAQASKAGAAFQWDLGDGTTASGASVKHLYPSAGDYSVQVTATRGDESATAESRISVSKTPPLRLPRRVQRVFAVHSR
ncbi:MAG: PKD domain-containing protein, partial [Acidobacteria bacterium]|nr:PKD domain-containing protein [Acidobacteriota bacterium]